MFIEKSLLDRVLASIPAMYRRIYPAAELITNKLRVLMVTKS